MTYWTCTCKAVNAGEAATMKPTEEQIDAVARARAGGVVKLMRNPIQYPLRAARLNLSIRPFGFWVMPRFYRMANLTEQAKVDGTVQWYARWAWFQVSYGRWV